MTRSAESKVYRFRVQGVLWAILYGRPSTLWIQVQLKQEAGEIYKYELQSGITSFWFALVPLLLSLVLWLFVCFRVLHVYEAHLYCINLCTVLSSAGR